MNIYVGNDKEYQTIQAAVDSLGEVIYEDTHIYVDSGIYKEYVKMRNKRGYTITISGSKDGELTNVKGFEILDVNLLLKIENFKFVWSDTIIDEQAVVRFSRCNYASLDNLIFEGKAREGNNGQGIYTVEFDGSIGAIHNSYFNNQLTCIYAKNGSQIRVDGNNTHSNNPSNYFLFSQSAIIHYLGGVSLPSGTTNKEYKAGRIFT